MRSCSPAPVISLAQINYKIFFKNKKKMLSQATIKVNFKGNMKDTLFKCNKNLTFKNQLLFSLIICVAFLVSFYFHADLYSLSFTNFGLCFVLVFLGPWVLMLIVYLIGFLFFCCRHLLLWTALFELVVQHPQSFGLLYCHFYPFQCIF